MEKGEKNTYRFSTECYQKKSFQLEKVGFTHFETIKKERTTGFMHAYKRDSTHKIHHLQNLSTKGALLRIKAPLVP